MKLKANKIDFSTKSNGDMVVELIVKDYQDKRIMQHSYDSLKDLTELSVEVKKYRNKRSLSANGYLWALLNKIAEVVNRTKDDIYLEMLKRYGVSTYMTANKKAFERIKEQWKTVEIVDEKQQQGHDIVKLLCYYGSSTYDSKEFTRLLDGVINEAKDLDIETITPQEKALLMENYGGKEC